MTCSQGGLGRRDPRRGRLADHRGDSAPSRRAAGRS